MPVHQDQAYRYPTFNCPRPFENQPFFDRRRQNERSPNRHSRDKTEAGQNQGYRSHLNPIARPYEQPVFGNGNTASRPPTMCRSVKLAGGASKDDEDVTVQAGSAGSAHLFTENKHKQLGSQGKSTNVEDEDYLEEIYVYQVNDSGYAKTR
jgi:hypothetical protein